MTAPSQAAPSADTSTKPLPVAEDVCQLLPISVRAAGDMSGDTVVLTFGELTAWNAVSVLGQLARRVGLNSATLEVDGNIVTLPVPKRNNVDRIVTALRKAVEPQFRYAARAAVVEESCDCGAGGSTGVYRGEICLDLPISREDIRRLQERLGTVTGLEGVDVRDGQALYLLPNRYARADRFATRRAIRRVIQLLGIEILDDIEFELADAGTDADSESDGDAEPVAATPTADDPIGEALGSLFGIFGTALKGAVIISGGTLRG